MAALVLRQQLLVVLTLRVVPVSFSRREKLDRTVRIGHTDVQIYGPSAREDVLSSVIDEFPDVVVVDYTAPDSVNSNAELYCKLGLPFVMGTTGGDQQLLHKSVQDSNNYALISPQMGKQVVAFLAAMKIMAEQFPGAFSGYHLEVQFYLQYSLRNSRFGKKVADIAKVFKLLLQEPVLESHQADKLDISGTAKAVIACFEKLGVSYDMNMIVKLRDPEQQLDMVGVPEEHIEGHAFHLYHLSSPNGRLNTRNILKRKKQKLERNNYDCVLCDRNLEETAFHLFFGCPFSQSCW